MSERKATEDAVQKAISELRAEGLTPTADRIRAKVGGSKSTILDILRALRGSAEGGGIDPPEGLVSQMDTAMRTAWTKMQQDAEARIAAEVGDVSEERDRLQVELVTIKGERDELRRTLNQQGDHAQELARMIEAQRQELEAERRRGDSLVAESQQQVERERGRASAAIEDYKKEVAGELARVRHEGEVARLALDQDRNELQQRLEVERRRHQDAIEFERTAARDQLMQAGEEIKASYMEKIASLEADAEALRKQMVEQTHASMQKDSAHLAELAKVQEDNRRLLSMLEKERTEFYQARGQIVEVLRRLDRIEATQTKQAEPAAPAADAAKRQAPLFDAPASAETPTKTTKRSHKRKAPAPAPVA